MDTSKSSLSASELLHGAAQRVDIAELRLELTLDDLDPPRGVAGVRRRGLRGTDLRVAYVRIEANLA